jgi:hypothetical protein
MYIDYFMLTDAEYTPLYTKTVGVILLFSRFICASILHLSLIDDVSSALDNMKFALNHTYLFQDYSIAFTSAFFQFFTTVMTEVANDILILTALDPINCTLNFISLAIIAEFDNYVYEALRNESMKKLLEAEVTEKVLVIMRTSSKKCKENEFSKVKDEDGEYLPLKIPFLGGGENGRTCGNKCLYVLYKIMRAFFVSVYFYFLPFMTILLTVLIPLLSLTLE